MCKDTDREHSLVKEYGEVFTPYSVASLMNSMMTQDIVDKEEYILNSVVDQACGNGQLLLAALKSKIEKISEFPKEIREELLIKAVSSIYGMDIQDKNAKATRSRLYNLAIGKDVYTYEFKVDGGIDIKTDIGVEISSKVKRAIKRILEVNILCGDTIKMELQDSSDGMYIYKYNYSGNKVGVEVLLYTNNDVFNLNTHIDIDDYDKSIVDIKDIAKLLNYSACKDWR